MSAINLIKPNSIKLAVSFVTSPGSAGTQPVRFHLGILPLTFTAWKLYIDRSDFTFTQIVHLAINI